MSNRDVAIDWYWRTFGELSNAQIYDILAVRQQVFVLEQKCLYLDVDGRDREALHLLGNNCANQIVAYARLLPPNTRYAEPSIGRVLVVESARGTGLGRELVQRCLEKCELPYGDYSVKISAQVYLREFYQSFGFEGVGEPYDDGGIPHVEMVR
ncbi:MAG: GNAT family N-acetyltransferase [Leptolyngbya foveolarum]|uniref:GNAT family N-acetyltransferase n=1 Tax=Leptolyngbya foveolarum TaxID=47253 RepID=A0A2W4TSA3_9CYAN|nr:MAG: GNAT family N-acetyltransferase [Leptolyngbya foveolarum]